MNYRLKINCRDINTRILDTRIKIRDAFGMDTRTLRERRTSKYFAIHNRGTYDYNAEDTIYDMREAIAGFAKKNGLKIDMYNPNEIRDIDDSSIKDLEITHPKTLAIVVTDKFHNIKAKIFDSNTTGVFPKIREGYYVANIAGEDTQISRKTESHTEDSFLRHILREIETMVSELNNHK